MMELIVVVKNEAYLLEKQECAKRREDKVDLFAKYWRTSKDFYV